jgi:uncharacterized membrane protein
VLPFLFTFVWMATLLRARSSLNVAVILILSMILSAVIVSMPCIALVWSQGKDDKG